MGPLFIWLGSGRARRRGIHKRGALLDQAARAGLPVPPGAILPHELFRLFLDKGLVARSGERVTVPDTELFYNTLFLSVRLPRFARPVIMQAIVTEGCSGLAPSPAVDPDDSEAFVRALAVVWTYLAGCPESVRADVLVMETVDGEHSGRAITGSEPDDLIALDPGVVAGDMLPLAVDADGRPPHARRLRLLLGGVRRTFGKGGWEIEWVDDGRVCHLLSIAPNGQPAAAT